MIRKPRIAIRHIRSAILIVFTIAVTCLPVLAETLVGRDSWGVAPKYIAIQPGTTVSVWSTADRAQITGGAVAMSPVGDGTYEYIVGLTAGQSYNYLFYTRPGATAIQGLQAGNEYYDIVPTIGTIRCGRNAPLYNDTSAYYSSVNYDARRVLAVPSTMNPGETLWVFNNWGETPGVISGFTGNGEGDTSIRLNWTGTYGFWGTGGEAFKSADVLAGGMIEIYRSASPLTGYALRDTVTGGSTTYLDTNLAPGSYYYMVRALDAYKGLGYASDSYRTLRGGSDSPVVNTYIQCTTALSIRSFFIVQGGDWDYIKDHNYRAWFSESTGDPWCEKFPATIAVVTLPDRRKNGTDVPTNQNIASLNPQR
ncbi:MAG: hypothetical protein AAB229_02880 [Candidatus Hydrogenedentota bacterium]|mgnify:CR=1 FL=1